jgi:adenylate kinase
MQKNYCDAMRNDILTFESVSGDVAAARRQQLEKLSDDDLDGVVCANREKQTMRVVLVGSPGSGKGTQAIRIAERLGIPHLSIGQMLRDAVARGSELGRRIAPAMETGELLDDHIVIAVAIERLWHADARVGFVLDGFPRTVEQAKALDTHLASFGASLDAVIELAVEHDVLLNRITARADAATARGEPARADDTAEVLRRRIEVYVAQTVPVIAHFEDGRGIYYPVDGHQSADEVAAAIAEILDAVDAERRRRIDANLVGLVRPLRTVGSPAEERPTPTASSPRGVSLPVACGLAIAASAGGGLLGLFGAPLVLRLLWG